MAKTAGGRFLKNGVLGFEEAFAVSIKTSKPEPQSIEDLSIEDFP